MIKKLQFGHKTGVSSGKSGGILNAKSKTAHFNKIKIYMKMHKNPKWWTPENDSAWSHIKEAMRRDWDQTKHDFGGDQPETHQNVSHTVRQASGTEVLPPRHEPTYEQAEPAHRYGYAARSKYGTEYADWEQAEARLQKEWEELEPAHRQTWMQDRAAIRYGWEFEP